MLQVLFNDSNLLFGYLKDVAKFINQLKRDDENLRSVQDVQERLGYLSGY